MSYPENRAWPGHPVIREILRRKAEGIAGNFGRPGPRLGLVIEGGAMRGVYSGGALVAMEELGLSGVFDDVYGESAGATNSCYFLSRQASFGIRIYLEDLPSLKFVNPFRLGRMLDLDYAIDTVVAKVKPLNVEKVLASPSNLYIALTNAHTGLGRMVEAKGQKTPLLTLLKASGALTPLYNHPVMIDGEPYVDGGIANPIPVRSAIEHGCTHILVLLTRANGFVGRLNLAERLFLAPLCRRWTPGFREAYFGLHMQLYNKTRALALGRDAAPGVEIAVISPVVGSPLLDRATISRKKLLAAMEDARRQTHEALRPG
jgi:predicted acylesterase/phospholipase RssA